jgi:hypothetical protein
MVEDLKLTVFSPGGDRQKLDPEKLPPGFPGPGALDFEPASVRFAERLDTLENKTVYLVDIGFGGGYNFMLEIQRWFAEHMPSVTTIPRRKPGAVFADTDNEELWQETKEKGDAVVIGVAG